MPQVNSLLDLLKFKSGLTIDLRQRRSFPDYKFGFRNLFRRLVCQWEFWGTFIPDFVMRIALFIIYISQFLDCHSELYFATPY